MVAHGQNKKTRGGGLIKTILVIAVIVVALGFFGFDIEAIIKTPLVQKNLLFVTNIATYVWKTFLAGPFIFIWDTIIVGIIGNALRALLNQLPSGTP